VLASVGGEPASSAHVKQASGLGSGGPTAPPRRTTFLGWSFAVVQPNQTCHDSIR